MLAIGRAGVVAERDFVRCITMGLDFRLLADLSQVLAPHNPALAQTSVAIYGFQERQRGRAAERRIEVLRDKQFALRERERRDRKAYNEKRLEAQRLAHIDAQAARAEERDYRDRALNAQIAASKAQFDAALREAKKARKRSKLSAFGSIIGGIAGSFL